MQASSTRFLRCLQGQEGEERLASEARSRRSAQLPSCVETTDGGGEMRKDEEEGRMRFGREVSMRWDRRWKRRSTRTTTSHFATST